MNFEKISVTYQHDSMQCGTACLQMICNFFGREYTMDSLSKLCFATTEGVSLLGINEAANTLGLRTISQCKWTFCPNILDFASIRNVPIQRSCKYLTNTFIYSCFSSLARFNKRVLMDFPIFFVIVLSPNM